VLCLLWSAGAWSMSDDPANEYGIPGGGRWRGTYLTLNLKLHRQTGDTGRRVLLVHYVARRVAAISRQSASAYAGRDRDRELIDVRAL